MRTIEEVIEKLARDRDNTANRPGYTIGYEDEVEVLQGTFYDNDIVSYGYNILDLIVRWRQKNG